jgi:hypothetical protein
MAAAIDATNDTNADIDVARAAHAALEDFRCKNQFEMQPSESDFARIAAVFGFTSEQIAAAWASYRRNGKFSAILAMSWQALKWAAQQRAGSLSANAVLRVYADHATKAGRTWVDSKTIAERLQTTKPTVLDAISRIIERGLMEDTGERVGKTGSVRVFQLKMALETNEKRSNSFTAKRYRSGKEAVKKQTNSFTAGIGETASNPLTRNQEEEEKSRGALRRPTNEDEIYEYIFCENDPRTEPLQEFLISLEDHDHERNISWFWQANELSDWKRCKGDWRSYLLLTFARGMFPSQRRPPKKKQER